MRSTNDIEYGGKVIGTDSNQYIINVLCLSACSACHAKGSCSSLDKKDKFVHINRTECRELSIGDEVIVVMSKKSGEFAYIVAYVVPVVLLIATVIFLKLNDINQATGAISIMALVAIYFVGLYMTRKRFEKRVKIKIR